MNTQKIQFHPDGIFGGFSDPLQQRAFLKIRGLSISNLKELIVRQRELMV